MQAAKAITDEELTFLVELSKSYPTTDSVLARISMLQAALAIPKGIVHVVSDVHGEYGKLRHVINNAAGSLRPLVEKIFTGRLSEPLQLQLLKFIYYPREAFEFVSA